MQRLLFQRVHFERNVLATLLPAIAGAVNASGFFAVGTYTSHMTGLVSRVGDELAQGHFWIGLRVLIFVGSFMLGAMMATWQILRARKRNQPAFWRPLLLEAFTLLGFATFTVSTEGRVHLDSFSMTALICFSMGAQNALVSKLSGARIRTTHLTGVSTDIGIELMKTLLRWRDRSSGRTILQRIRSIAHVASDVESRHLRLHLRIFFCCLLGATSGPALYLMVGHWAMLIPVAALCGLALFDYRFGLGSLTVLEHAEGSADPSAAGR